MVAEAQLEERERRNAELFEQVQQGIDQLKALQQPVTQRAISNMIEIPHSLLRRRPHILRVLQQHSQHQIFQESALSAQKVPVVALASRLFLQLQ